MRALRLIVSFVFIVVLAAYMFFHYTKSTDNTIPKIKCDVPVIEISVNEGNSALLKHITAVDEKDGDISSKIIVEKSSAFVDFGRVITTFAVCDNDDNVAKINVPVVYTDYQNPKFTFTDDLVFKTGSGASVENAIHVTDSFDGDITDRLVVIANGAEIEKSGRYPITLKVTNSKSYTYSMNVDIIMSDYFETGYKVELKDYFIYKKVGETVDYESMIKSVANPLKGAEETEIEIDSSAVNSMKQGVYNVYYYQKSGSRTRSMTRLIVCYEG